MRILLDECAPRPLAGELTEHDVRTVPQMGWAGKKNGELLTLMAAAQFDVFITVDQNLSFQQNLRNAAVAVVILAAPNRLESLLPLIPDLRRALAGIRTGQVVVIPAILAP